MLEKILGDVLVAALTPALVVAIKVKRKHLIGGVIISLGLFFTIELFIIFKTTPDIDTAQKHPTQNIQIVDRYGTLLYELLEDSKGRYSVVNFEKIPKHLIAATLATEDINFYQHPGFDLKGIVRAFYLNMREGKIVSGGSTITQQVVRNYFLSNNNHQDKTIRRKIQEAYLAWKLSQDLSKDEVLGIYLNNIYYGAMAYGVEAAAQTYFGKSVTELDLAECAMIAGLPQAPALYNPYTNFEAAKKRQKIVLDLMYKHQLISNDDLTLALNEILRLNETPYPMKAPHFVMMVRNQYDTLRPELDNIITAMDKSGFIITTTLDLNWQFLAEKAIYNQLDQTKKNTEGMSYNVNNASLIALDAASGEILALVGSPDYFDQDHAGAINMAITPRQPGSALKPFIYAAVLDPVQPNSWTAATMILDFHTSFLTKDGKTYKPENFDRKEHGPVSVREALASSLNIPAVIALNQIGVENFINYSRRFGITSLDTAREYDLSIALGGASVTLLELSSAYACFANNGYRLEPQLIMAIGDDDGNVIYKPHLDTPVRVLDERLAWLVNDILSDSKARWIGFGKDTILQLDRPAAAKTGTTTNFHDNWTIGYTPQVVVGVWVGNTNYLPMRDITGLTGAAPIWHQFMRSILVNYPVKNFNMPDGMINIEICHPSGMLATSICPNKRFEWFIDGTQPIMADDLFSEIMIDLRTGKNSSADTPVDFMERKTIINLPESAEAWAHNHGFLLLSEVTKTNGTNGNLLNDHPLHIQYPADRSIFRLSDQIPIDNQSIKIVLYTNNPVNQITLWINDQPIANLNTPPYEYWWVPQTGDYRLWATTTAEESTIISSQVISFTVLPAMK